jgi:hypothetical protein
MGEIIVAAQLAKLPVTYAFNQTIRVLGAPQVG